MSTKSSYDKCNLLKVIDNKIGILHPLFIYEIIF